MKREVRVTTVLSRLQSFGNIDPEVLKNKAQIGTDVHSAIEASTRGDWFPLEEERRIAYFGSYGMWSGTKTYNYVHTELELTDPDLCLIGHVDAVIEDDMKVAYLLDFKTSAKESVTPEGLNIWNMQAHMYYHLLKVNGIHVKPEFMFLQLKTNKKNDDYLPAKPKLYTYAYDQAVMDRCLEEVHKYWYEYDEAMIFN